MEKKPWYARTRLHDLKYTHVIRHYAQDEIKRGKFKRGAVNNYLAANVRKTSTHIIYESENAWNQVVETRVPIGDVIEIKEYSEDE